VQVGSSCSALGSLVCLGDKPLAVSLPFGLLVFVVLESELYPVSFLDLMEDAVPSVWLRLGWTPRSSRPRVPSEGRAALTISCVYLQGACFPFQRLNTSRSCEAVALGWECGQKRLLLKSILSFPAQAWVTWVAVFLLLHLM